MTTPVNLYSSLDPNVAQSNGVEPEVSQFSIINLLSPMGDSKESAPALDEFDNHEAAFQESSEEHKELTAAEFLQYWELPAPPVLEFRVEATANSDLNEPTVKDTDNLIFINSMPDNNVNKPVSDLATTPAFEPITDNKLSAPIKDAIPLNNAFNAEAQKMIAPIVVQQNPSLNPMDDSVQPLNSLDVEMQQATPSESIMNALNPDTHETIAALINEKEQGDVYSYQPAEIMKNLKENKADSFTDREQKDSLAPQLMEQNPAPVSEVLFPMKSENASSFKDDDMVAPSNSALLTEGQVLATSDTRVQQLTNHLNDFLNHTMTSKVQPQVSAADNFQSQFRMELLSLKPEILADHSNYKAENYTAQINLHPAELGQITAKIEVIQGATTITFMTEHAHVQKLMEHHLPELHNVFQNSELNLTSVNIHNGDAQDKRESSAYQRPEEDDLNLIDNHSKSIGINNNQRKKSIIDTYA